MSDAETKEQLIVVIGASSDIAAAYMRLADAPTTTFVAQYFKSADKLNALAQELQAKVLPMQCDLADPGQVDALLQHILSVGTPDSMVFLAAPPSRIDRFHKKDWAPFASHLEIQLRAPVCLLQGLLPKMSKRKQGQVVFVSSSCTLGIPPKGMSDYVVAKYALNGLVKALASEYAAKGLRFNAVSPSMVDTAYVESFPRISVEMSADSNPLKRNASVDDVAPLIHFLLSPDSTYINGAIVPVTAGSAM